MKTFCLCLWYSRLKIFYISNCGFQGRVTLFQSTREIIHSGNTICVSIYVESRVIYYNLFTCLGCCLSNIHRNFLYTFELLVSILIKLVFKEFEQHSIDIGYSSFTSLCKVSHFSSKLGEFPIGGTSWGRTLLHANSMFAVNSRREEGSQVNKTATVQSGTSLEEETDLG